MLKVFSSPHEIYETAARIWVETAQEAIRRSGRFTVALTGGSSPAGLYRLLATDPYKSQVDWGKVMIFWGDERWVPLTDELSNAKMAYDTLLNHVSVPASHIFPMYRANTEPEKYAEEYATVLKDVLGEEGRMDLILLGMGDDGHTASLFPGTEVLKEQSRWVDAYYLAPQQMHRITLTAPFLNRAGKLLVLTFGPKKAPALKEVLQGKFAPAVYPAQLLKPAAGELLFLADEAAAGLLN